MADDEHLGFKVGDQVAMDGFDKPGHIHFGIVAKIVGFRQFQNASNDDWYWSALVEYSFMGETTSGPYPLKFLKHYEGKKSSRA